MTSLFRPWTEQNSNSNPAGEITKLLERVNDSSETKPSSAESEDSSSRENRYKSVKEHMKKRSEKYYLKKLKLNPRPEVKPVEMGNVVVPTVTPLNVPTSCCDGFYNPFECLLPTKPMTPPSVGFVTANPELLETALSSGFPPNLFEEYARFLTEQQKQVADRTRKQRPKKFRCPHCHVGFSNNGQLKGHIRIHTGERPFKCDAESCGKSFTRNEELTRHRRIHSGLRPFPCSECGKRFGRKDHLKKHVKTHYQQRYQLVPILPSHCPYFYGL